MAHVGTQARGGCLSGGMCLAWPSIYLGDLARHPVRSVRNEHAETEGISVRITESGNSRAALAVVVASSKPIECQCCSKSSRNVSIRFANPQRAEGSDDRT